MKKKERRLITSALPYVNNIPHLGNLIQMLSADVFARFCRSRGYETLYICGTDEYGTATETKALQEKKSPQELCDYYHNIHKKIYEWFDISFDNFGRTSTQEQTQIVQELFTLLDKNGYITEHETSQLFCPKCSRFLADRYVTGICPKCGYPKARGDQCESCGSLLDPTDLKDAKCSVCGATPILKNTKHLYINLPKIQEKYKPWLQKTSVEGKWAKNALQMTLSWAKEGLKERAITRDLKWGVKVPKAGYDDKVFYVWFDAPIGYMSITSALYNRLKNEGKDTQSRDWKYWWLPTQKQNQEAGEVKLFQFIGKDNIPFHTVIFPSTLIGSGLNWTKLFHMSSSEYLNYESGKFSKSQGIGVFGSDAMESGIKADAWRFYIFYNRPEKQDTQFTWKDFGEKYNGELIGNLGNLVNRTLLFVTRYFAGEIPSVPIDKELWACIEQKEKQIADLLEWAELKDAFHEIFALSDLCNKAFQAGEPWKTRTTDIDKCKTLIATLCYAIKDLMIMAHPYMPQYTQAVMGFFGKTISDKRAGKEDKKDALNWDDVGAVLGLSSVKNTAIYFSPLDAKAIDAYRIKYSGTQEQRSQQQTQNTNSKKAQTQKDNKGAEQEPAPLPPEQQIAVFNSKIALKVAKIISVEKNPNSDKLYIEHLDCGAGETRVIQSGLVPYLKEEELLSKNIILAANLAPRKMRGVESHGMLLAADYIDENGKDCVEVLAAPDVPVGTPVVLEGADPNFQKPQEITADDFFSIEIKVKDKTVTIAGKKLLAGEKPLKTDKTVAGDVH